MANNNNEGWHVKKEVNIAHVLTTAAVIFSGFWFFADLDKRIDNNAIELRHVKLTRVEDQKRQANDQQRIEKGLDGMNAKLDKLLAKLLENK